MQSFRYSLESRIYDYIFKLLCVCYFLDFLFRELIGMENNFFQCCLVLKELLREIVEVFLILVLKKGEV